MKKKKIFMKLFMAALLMGGIISPFKAVAQTDVTNTYLTNADLENTYKVQSYPRNDSGQERAIYEPNGWTVTYTNGESNDITSLNNNCLQWNNFSSRQQPVNGGSNVYWIRFRWGSNSSIKLSQTVNNLPAGTYRLSADAFWINSTSSATLSAGDQSVIIDSRNSWANYGVVFTLSAATNVEIAFNFTQTATNECIAGVDNFKIERFDQSTIDLAWSWTTMISNAGMELGTSTTNGAGWNASSINTPYGFTLMTSLEGWKDGTINTTNPSEGSKLYNLWAGTVTSTNMYQDIILPMGKYTITADMRIDNMTNVNDQGVYAKVGDNTFKSGTITNVASTWNSVDGWNTLSKTFYVPSDKTSVRVGVSSTGSSGSQGWYQLDNITLTYLGSVAKAATNITLGEATTITADKWYSLNVGTTDYQFNSTAATTLYYTQNGYDSPGDVTTTQSLSVGNTTKALINGTLYFRATVTTTLTVSALSYSEGQDLTSLITNPSFESNGKVDLSAENLTGVTGWDLASASNTTDVGTRAYGNEGSTYYTYNGVGSYCFNCYWQGKPLTQSLGSLPAGTYELSALVTTGNAESIGTVYLNANDNISTGYSRKGSASYMFREKLVFTVTETASVTIGIRGGDNIEGGSSKGAYNANGYWWYKCDDFKLTYLCKPTQANLYSQLSTLLSDCEPWTTSGEYYTNYTTYSAFTESNTISELTTAINYLTNEYEKYALANATNAHPYDLDLILNPSYSNDQTSWNTALNQTGGGGYSVASDGTQTNYFNSYYNTWMRHSSVYQEGILLDEGIYKLSAKMKGTPKDDVSTYIYATTGSVDHWGSTLFAGDTYYGYLTQAAATSWSTVDAYVTLDTPSKVRIGVLSWGNNWNGGNGGAFSVDDWKLEKIDNAVVTKDGIVTVYGAAPLGSINAALTSSVGAVNIQQATGLSSSAIDTRNNPNLLIFANSGQVSNTNNVVVDGNCSNLVLVDGYPFINPTSFTANSASYSLSSVASGKDAENNNVTSGTLMIPFAASTLAGTAYALDQNINLIDGNIRGTSVGTIAANSPVLVTAAGDYSGSSVTVPAVAAGATYTNGELVGTYTAISAPTSSYVLQNHTNGEGVAFYLVGSTQPTVNPFRAYIKAQSSNVRTLHFLFDDETDGINSVENGKWTMDNAAIYNISGQRVSKPARGLYIVNGKKVVIK